MSFEISLHRVEKVTAEATQGKSASWVDITFGFERTISGERPEPFTLTVFVGDDDVLADALARAINSINSGSPVHVARNEDELRTQLQGSVLLLEPRS